MTWAESRNTDPLLRCILHVSEVAVQPAAGSAIGGYASAGLHSQSVSCSSAAALHLAYCAWPWVRQACCCKPQVVQLWDSVMAFNLKRGMAITNDATWHDLLCLTGGRCFCCSNNAWSLESLALVKPSGAPRPAVNPTQLAAALSLPPGRHVLSEVRCFVGNRLCMHAAFCMHTTARLV